MWLLILNDMRAAKFEQGDRAWARAHTQEALEEFYNAEKVESYTEQEGSKTWVRNFRKDGPLYWANNGRAEGLPIYMFVPPKEEFMQEAAELAGEQWDSDIAALPCIGGEDPAAARIKEAFYQAAVEFSHANDYLNTDELEAAVDRAWEEYAAEKGLV
jgi:hypothetical protein